VSACRRSAAAGCCHHCCVGSCKRMNSNSKVPLLSKARWRWHLMHVNWNLMHLLLVGRMPSAPNHRPCPARHSLIAAPVTLAAAVSSEQVPQACNQPATARDNSKRQWMCQDAAGSPFPQDVQAAQLCVYDVCMFIASLCESPEKLRTSCFCAALAAAASCRGPALLLCCVPGAPARAVTAASCCCRPGSLLAVSAGAAVHIAHLRLSRVLLLGEEVGPLHPSACRASAASSPSHPSCCCCCPCWVGKVTGDLQHAGRQQESCAAADHRNCAAMLLPGCARRDHNKGISAFQTQGMDRGTALLTHPAT
jgi:hypothetical protein